MTPRIGYGYDVHRTGEGKGIRLGGVDLDTPFALEAHSDGDVLVHALIDALLGAMALGDIGTHFPDDDPSFSNASGAELLRSTLAQIRANEHELGNLDLTIIAERPRLQPHIPDIRKNLALMGDWDLDRVSVKATTSEKLGPIGRGEGIAAHAVVLLVPMGDGSKKEP